MKIKLWQIALIIIIVIFGGIGIAMLTGNWATESDKVPAKFTTGDFAGEYNPEDIRGSYTFQDVADTFQIDLAVLLRCVRHPRRYRWHGHQEQGH